MPLLLPVEEFQVAHERLRDSSMPGEVDYLAMLETLPFHDLGSQAEALLDERSEVKYLMPMEVLPYFLPALADEYSVLRVRGSPLSTYQVTYFDTPARSLYHAHHNGHRCRSKYRLRRYAETDTSFLEIQHKESRRRTAKERFAWPLQSDQEGPDPALLARLERYEPALYVNYRRMSFWNTDSGDRLTVDFDLRFQRCDSDETARLPEEFVVELKRTGKFHGSTFFRRAKSYGFLPQAFSKYCVGCCLTDNGDLKTNRFKPLLSRLGRVEYTGEQ